MNLYVGKILRIDLTTGKITTEALNEKWARKFLGLWGLGMRYYWDAVTPDVPSLSPENAIVLMSGPLNGTLAPLTGRFGGVSKSPLTGTIFETNVGGSFGPELKYAGYDGIIIQGKAENPVFISIKDSQVELVDSHALWGKPVDEIENKLKDSVSDRQAKTLTIGPAGENLVPYACVTSEVHRNMGRAGMGCLFGSKNLKGIVCKGTGAVKVANIEAFQQLLRHCSSEKLMIADNLWARDGGTPNVFELTNELGIHPTKNFTYGVNPEKDRIGLDAMQKATIAKRACFSCPMACSAYTKAGKVLTEGPEYETLCLAGSNCEVNDLPTLMQFNLICGRLGMDTISAGATIALAMDLTERDIYDFDIRFGDKEGLLQVATEIGYGSTSRGKELGKGSKYIAENYQGEELVSHCKGMEFPAYDPRGNYGMGLAYATSERGGCHMRAWTVAHEDPFNLDAMAKEVSNQQWLKAAKYSLGFCDFWGTLDYQIMAELYSAGMGEKITAGDLKQSGQRIWNLTRIFNTRAGFTGEDDILPPKMMKTALKGGPQNGRVFSEADFVTCRQKYYEIQGWDGQGIPGSQLAKEMEL